MTLRIAITGSNGFLGKHTIKLALERGLGVNAIVRRESAAEVVENLGASPYIIKDFNTTALNQAFVGCYGAIHLSGIVREEGVNSFEMVNVQGTAAVVSAAKLAHIKRLVIPTGLGVDEYGKKDWATNGYFHSKLLVEDLIRGSSLPYIIFRPSFILGPGDELIPSLVKQLRRGIVRIAGEGTTPMQPVYVRDAATLFVSAATGLGPENVTLDLVGPNILNMLNLIEIVTRTLRDIGEPAPNPRVIHISLKDAPQAFDLSPEELGVMQCDKMGDANQVARAFNMKLAPPTVAIDAAVRHALALEVIK